MYRYQSNEDGLKMRRMVSNSVSESYDVTDRRVDSDRERSLVLQSVAVIERMVYSHRRRN